MTGTLTLSGPGDFKFDMGSTLITATGAKVVLAGGANQDNVFWAIGSSATLEANSQVYGHLIAYASITMNNGVTLYGSAKALNAAVTLINDRILK